MHVSEKHLGVKKNAALSLHGHGLGRRRAAHHFGLEFKAIFGVVLVLNFVDVVEGGEHQDRFVFHGRHGDEGHPDPETREKQEKKHPFHLELSFYFKTMWLILNVESYSSQFLHFMPPVKNNIMEQSSFVRIIYSLPYLTMQGLYLRMSPKIAAVEHSILSAYDIKKTKVYCLTKYSELTGFLKVSGIWENDNSYGLAYKIIH